MVSTLGFNTTVIKAVKEYNHSKNGLFQPIILLVPTPEHFGRFSDTLTGGVDVSGSSASQVSWGDPCHDFAIPCSKGVSVRTAQKTIGVTGFQDFYISSDLPQMRKRKRQEPKKTEQQTNTVRNYFTSKK